jgi:hypothetical protein
LADGLSFQASRLSGKGMISLPASFRKHSLASIRDTQEKLMLGGEITGQVPHSVVTLMDYKGQYWLTNGRMVRYQHMLCKNPQVKLKAVQTLKPDHNCAEVINEVFSSCQPL